jgi:hypothetical protein
MPMSPEEKKVYMREYSRMYYQKHKQKLKDRSKEWNANNKEQKKATSKSYYYKNYTKARKQRKEWNDRNDGYMKKYLKDYKKKRGAEYFADLSLKRKYGKGVSVEYKNALIQHQGKTCMVCDQPFPEDTKKIHLDHCHSTGHIRGVLCQTCNTKLGWFEKNEERVLAYLSHFR